MTAKLEMRPCPSCQRDCEYEVGGLLNCYCSQCDHCFEPKDSPYYGEAKHDSDSRKA